MDAGSERKLYFWVGELCLCVCVCVGGGGGGGEVVSSSRYIQTPGADL